MAHKRLVLVVVLSALGSSVPTLGGLGPAGLDGGLAWHCSSLNVLTSLW